jgi:hypothetical protein
MRSEVRLGLLLEERLAFHLGERSGMKLVLKFEVLLVALAPLSVDLHHTVEASCLGASCRLLQIHLSSLPP